MREISSIRELVVEVIYSNLGNNQSSIDPGEIQCTQSKVCTEHTNSTLTIIVQTLRHQLWTDWLASSGNMKRISLPPQPYGPVSQL